MRYYIYIVQPILPLLRYFKIMIWHKQKITVRQSWLVGPIHKTSGYLLSHWTSGGDYIRAK